MPTNERAANVAMELDPGSIHGYDWSRWTQCDAHYLNEIEPWLLTRDASILGTVRTKFKCNMLVRWIPLSHRKNGVKLHTT
jgi:hypothetical protein